MEGLVPEDPVGFANKGAALMAAAGEKEQ